MIRNFTSGMILLLMMVNISVPALAVDPSEDTLDITTTKHHYKDPVVAFRLAFFPGFLLHGRGHIYAGQRTEGAVLLASEAIACTLILFGLWETSDPEFFQSFPGNKGSSGVASSSGRQIITYGAMLFAIGWLADMTHSPWAAQKYNAVHHLNPAISPYENGVRLAFTKSF